MSEEVKIASEKWGDPLDLQWEKMLPEVVGETGGAQASSEVLAEAHTPLQNPSYSNPRPSTDSDLN